jgi:hypothetical protein
MLDRINANPVDPKGLSSRNRAEAAEAGRPREASETDEPKEKGGASGGDKVTLGAKAAEGTYRKPPVAEMTLDARLQVLRDLVAKTFEKQGLALTIDIGGGQTANLKDITPEQAAGLVAEDGYWGVDKTSQRIVDFAINAAGNDASKLEEIKKGILKGFSMAEKAFGGSLPEISKKTLDAAMSKLDEWAKDAAAQAPPEAAPAPA